MAATYSGDPAASDLDFVRFKTADTDVDNADVTDAEITAMLAYYPSKWQAAHACALKRVQKFARIALGSANPNLSQIVSAAKKLADQILSEAAQQGVAITIPSASESAKQLANDDTDRVPDRFSRGMNDFTPAFDSLDGSDVTV